MNKNTHISWYIIISCVFYFLSIWSRPFSFEIIGMWNLQIFKFSVSYHIIAFWTNLIQVWFFIFTKMLWYLYWTEYQHILVNSLFSLWIVSLLIFNIIPINLEIVAMLPLYTFLKQFYELGVIYECRRSNGSINGIFFLLMPLKSNFLPKPQFINCRLRFYTYFSQLVSLREIFKSFAKALGIS